MTTTPHLGNTVMSEQQSNAFVLYNEMLLNLDMLVQGVVLSATTTTPPVSPANGDSYIIPTGATGVWSTHIGEIAYYATNAWRYISPQNGLYYYVVDQVGVFYVYYSSAWQRIISPSIQGVGVGSYYRPALSIASTAFQMISGTAYFVYIGPANRAVTPLYVCTHIAVAGSPSGTAGEFGIFSSPSAPNKSSQTLTKIVAAASSDWNTTGVKRNASPFATAVTPGAHLWVGMRSAMATTQPQTAGLNFGLGQGVVLTQGSATAFTSGTTYNPTVPSASTNPICPLLSLET